MKGDDTNKMPGTLLALKKCSFSHCSSVFLLDPASAGHLDTSYRIKAPVHFVAVPHFIDEALRWHDLAKATRPLGDQAWDHVSLTRNLNVLRNDYAKSICRTNGCHHLCPLVLFLMTCPRQVRTQRPKAHRQLS